MPTIERSLPPLPLRVVSVAWIDHTYSNAESWWGQGELSDEGPFMMVSVGLLVFENADCIILACEEHNGKYRHWTRIIRSLVQSVTVFRPHFDGVINGEG